LASRAKHKEYLVEVDGLNVPIKIFKERRNSIRASLGKKHAILRLPLFLNKKEEQAQIDKFYIWLRDKVLVDDRFRKRFESKGFYSGYEFNLYDESYRIKIENSRNKNHSAKYLGQNIISVKLAQGISIENAEKEITLLVSRVIAKLYHRDVEQRVHSLNAQYFQKQIKNVRLKYNQSNWGSCSNSSNINLSTRLLFAPQWVQNYVIIHELAHLSEMNHSKRFWKIVSDIMPEYKKAEKWLKQHGHKCDF